MRAALFKGPGAPLEIGEASDPIPAQDEVIVRVKACGVCGSDFHAARSSDIRMPPGTIMGHEFAGIVEKVGRDVSALAVGDAVAGFSWVACGNCPLCAGGITGRCLNPRPLGFGEIPGAFAELVKSRPAGLYKLPAGLSFRSAAMLEPLVTALHGLHRARFQAGESCVVIGAGAIGMMTVMWAQLAGARAIVVSGTSPARNLAMKLGASAVVDPRIRRASAELIRLIGSGPDVIFECGGAPGTLAQAISEASRGGRIAVLAAAMDDDGFPPALAMKRELDVHFCFGFEPDEVETTLAMLASGRLPIEDFATHRVGLDELPRAFASFSEAELPGKLILEL
jgi:(R,R)-butanediol dehydrogenase/meso-butanediol dehydrogenase/diacetyl reductase